MVLLPPVLVQATEVTTSVPNDASLTLRRSTLDFESFSLSDPAPFFIEFFRDKSHGSFGHAAIVLKAVAATAGFQVVFVRDAERIELHVQAVGAVPPAVILRVAAK